MPIAAMVAGSHQGMTSPAPFPFAGQFGVRWSRGARGRVPRLAHRMPRPSPNGRPSRRFGRAIRATARWRVASAPKCTPGFPPCAEHMPGANIRAESRTYADELVRARLPGKGRGPGVDADINRIVELWRFARAFLGLAGRRGRRFFGRRGAYGLADLAYGVFAFLCAGGASFAHLRAAAARRSPPPSLRREALVGHNLPTRRSPSSGPVTSRRLSIAGVEAQRRPRPLPPS